MPHLSSQQRQLAVGGLCALLAVAAVFAYTATVSSEAATKRQQAIERYGGEQAQVMVALEDIGAGTALDAGNVMQTSWLTDLLPRTQVAESLDQLMGLVAEQDIKEGEPIVMERVGDGSSRISVPAGLEAVSVASDDVLAVGGSVQEGSFVDVYVETGEGAIVLLGKRILVLETSAVVDPGTANAITWVTLAVTPESVSELLSASCKGTIHLVLPGGQAVNEEA
ncbi:MAG: Flp pilus assembly protein CpaB [Coriobacteriales bacterium]